MKRTLSILLALCIGMLALSGCANGEKSPTGGWSVNTEFGEAAIPEDARTAFDTAEADYNGVGITPVAYLGSQVVAGLNYAYLCTSDNIAVTSRPSLSVVTVYRALDNSAKVSGVDQLNIADCISDSSGTQLDPSQLAGGWYFGDAVGSALPEDVQTAFDKATEGLTGVGYTPIAYLGSKVVAGVNYAVLCRAAAVTAEPSYALAVMVIYVDTQGSAQITSINGLQI